MLFDMSRFGVMLFLIGLKLVAGTDNNKRFWSDVIPYRSIKHRIRE